MTKTFRSAREIFRYYFPKQTEEERIAKMSPLEYGHYTAEKLLDDFRERIRID